MKARPIAPRLLIACLLFALRSSAQSTAPTTRPDAQTFDRMPVEMTIRQRTTVDVPGSDPAIRVTIQDITRGQTIVSLASDGQQTLLAPVSLSPGESAEFAVAGRSYALTLRSLDNKLLSDDSATFVISEVARKTLSEAEKLEKLLETVAQMKDATFIRNGQAHGAKEAAEHMRTKWRAAGDRIRTAEQFIEHAATRSSLTGRAYRIRLPDGVEQDAADLLRTRLAEIESGK